MPDKIKRNILGREVTKSKTYIGPPGVSKSDKAKVKTKTVRKGDTTKTREVTKYGGKRTVEKTKNYGVGGNSLTKKTVKSGGKTDRSVEVKKPGETFTYANMGPASQARAYNFQKKKLKK
jgi:uncharacterized protein with gpF-like domain